MLCVVEATIALMVTVTWAVRVGAARAWRRAAGAGRRARGGPVGAGPPLFASPARRALATLIRLLFAVVRPPEPPVPKRLNELVGLKVPWASSAVVPLA